MRAAATFLLDAAIIAVSASAVTAGLITATPAPATTPRVEHNQYAWLQAAVADAAAPQLTQLGGGDGR